MTIRITGEMLKRYTEDDLLRAVLLAYQVEERAFKPINGLASVAGVKRGVMIKALAGQTHLGGKPWIRIEKRLKAKMYHEWLNAQAELL
jgi:hypothetical protein